MVNADSLENQKKQILANLNETDLKQYIIILTNDYYKAFANNDVHDFNYNLQLLKEVVELYKEKYSNIIGFVYYNLFLNANILLTENVPDSTIKLANPFNYKLYESDELEEELTHDIEKIFNIDRIRARYNEKQTNKKIKPINN